MTRRFPNEHQAVGTGGACPAGAFAGLPGHVWRGLLCLAALVVLALCGRFEAGRFVYAAC